MSDLIYRAKTFAVSAHDGVNQRRKYTGDPYWTHPMRVARMVAATDNSTPEMVAAAWLHDTVEDTPVTLDEIVDRFGEEVAIYVYYLTDISTLDMGNRATRKAIDRRHTVSVRTTPYAHAVATIKLADCVDNSTSIVRYGKGFTPVYMREIAELVSQLSFGDPWLWAAAQMQIKKWEAEHG